MILYRYLEDVTVRNFQHGIDSKNRKTKLLIPHNAIAINVFAQMQNIYFALKSTAFSLAFKNEASFHRMS